MPCLNPLFTFTTHQTKLKQGGPSRLFSPPSDPFHYVSIRLGVTGRVCLCHLWQYHHYRDQWLWILASRLPSISVTDARWDKNKKKLASRGRCPGTTPFAVQQGKLSHGGNTLCRLLWYFPSSGFPNKYLCLGKLEAWHYLKAKGNWM